MSFYDKEIEQEEKDERYEKLLNAIEPLTKRIVALEKKCEGLSRRLNSSENASQNRVDL